MAGFYRKNGFVLQKHCFSQTELKPIKEAIRRFHEGCLEQNSTYYEQGVINSAYLTDHNHMPAADRQVMFELISSPRLLDILKPIMPDGIAFLNTQLFFGPLDPQKKNYWHRDVQYTGMSVAEQQVEMGATNVMHCRIALVDEPGIELVPGTHKRWDTSEEYETRMAENGRKVYDPLPNTRQIPLEAGDLLVFSAHMIHRGLYSPDRFALDIMFCDPMPSLLKYVKKECLPNDCELAALDPDNPLAVSVSQMSS